MADDGRKLYPPLRFGAVEEGVFRGAYPTLRNLRFLRRLQLRTIISLTPEPPTPDLSEWCEHEEVQLVHHQVPRFSNDSTNLEPKVVASTLAVLIDTDNLPVYVHCMDGVQSAGLVVMFLRKLQHWAMPAVLAEYARVTAQPVPPFVERFVLDFMEEVVVREHLPAWLWDGQRAVVHPTMKLRFDPPLQAKQPRSNTPPKNFFDAHRWNPEEPASAEQHGDGADAEYTASRVLKSRTLQALDLEHPKAGGRGRRIPR